MQVMVVVEKHIDDTFDSNIEPCELWIDGLPLPRDLDHIQSFLAPPLLVD